MKIFKSYQEAQLAYPNIKIVTPSPDWDGSSDLIGTFQPYDVKPYGQQPLGAGDWVTCNPEVYCMSLTQFLSQGYKLVDGDTYITEHGVIYTIGEDVIAQLINSRPADKTQNRFILNTNALVVNTEKELKPFKLGATYLLRPGCENKIQITPSMEKAGITIGKLRQFTVGKGNELTRLNQIMINGVISVLYDKRKYYQRIDNKKANKT